MAAPARTSVANPCPFTLDRDCPNYLPGRLQPKARPQRDMRIGNPQLRRSELHSNSPPIAPQTAPISAHLSVSDEAKSSILAGGAWWAVQDLNL
jgi:hypothetical protein